MVKRRVMLMELHVDGSHKSTKVAYCLPTGEFLFATSEAAALFASSSTDKLFGRNLFHLLCPQDIDRLSQYVQWFTVRGYEEMVHQPPLLLRIAASSAILWLSCVSVPMTLRLLRCIDRAKMINPMQLFANESTFVINEQEYLEVIANEAFSPSGSCDDRAEALEKGHVRAVVNPPLELKLSMDWHEALTREKSLQQLSDLDRINMKLRSQDEDLVVKEQYALADFAFEADWACEIPAVEPTITF